MSEVVGVCFMVLLILGILALVSFVTKPTAEAGVQIKNKEGQKEIFKKQVPALYYIHRASILDTSMEIVVPWKYSIHRSDDSIKNSAFRGWYNFLWLSTLCFILSHFLSNYRSNGYVLFQTAFFKSLFPYVHELVVVFLPVYCWSFWAFFLQKLMISNIFGRKYTRTIIHIFQHILQTILIFGVGKFIYSECTHWPFSQKLALLLETMCLYMKMHSYLLSNHDLYTMKESSIRQQKEKDQQSNENEPKTLTLEECDHLPDSEVKEQLLRRGLGNVDNLFESSNARGSPNYFCFFAKALETQQLKQQNGLANGKESSHSMEESQFDPQKAKATYLRNVLKDTIFIQEYRRTIYPANVTLWNWFEFTCLPILVYEPIYPRMPSIRPVYLLEKILSVIFILVSIWSILEKYIYPILAHSEEMSVFESILMLTFPVTMLEILLFFLIFDCILNAIAEMTRFADRQFYLDWWNSTSFIEFSRKWNRPVHEFLLRHVYLESMNSYKFGKNLATAGTFIFSVALHEVVLCACLHRFRPWLAALSLFQLPLIPIMSAPIFHGKSLGNIIFWVGIIIGMPLVAVLYARDYCSANFCTPGNK